jgi:transcriptional regulator with XRE-family HTH domain
VSADKDGRRELAKFLRNRRERISPAEVGLPSGARRRTTGLRREEVAVLAGLSLTWYAYLEQGRSIRPSRAVLDSLARVLRLTEDERRYIHRLALGIAIQANPIDADSPAIDLTRQVLEQFDDSPFPVYAADHHCNIVAWNQAACEWYDNWDAMPVAERNLLRWLVSSPLARERIVDWERATRDLVARWRAECANRPGDPDIQRWVDEFSRLNPAFAVWWEHHEVLEQQSAIRQFRHGHMGVQTMRIVPLQCPELSPMGIALHLPLLVHS